MTDVSTPISLIHTKLHRPPVYVAHIHRQRLLDQLDQRYKRPMTLISAPAGYRSPTGFYRLFESRSAGRQTQHRNWHRSGRTGNRGRDDSLV